MPKSFPEPIRAVIDKALGYQPDDRFESALQFNLALEGAMVEIGEPTTAAIVAHYTGQLLGERKAARKRAVDMALEQAKRRDAGAGPATPNRVLVPIAAQSQGTIPLPTVQPHSTPPAPAVAPAEPPPEAFNPASTMSPSQTGQAQNQYAQHGLAETPSATSATLGLANIEYPEVNSFAAATRRRNRYIGAATLGVCGAAAVVGIILIVATQVMGQPKDGGKSARPGEPPPAASLATTPTSPENNAETPEAKPSGADVPRATDSVAAAPETPEPTAEPAASAAPIPPPPPTNPVAAHVDPPRPPPPVHKWQPPPQPAPKPTGKKPIDRGF
jgi:hypothetical protein